MKISRLNAILFVGFAIGLCLLFQWRPDVSTTEQAAVPAAGNVNTLLSAYDRWKQQAVRSGSDRALLLPLSYAKGLSSGFTEARGVATLNLINGSLSVKVSGLSSAEQYDVWLVDNEPARKGNADSNVGKRRIHVGRLAHRNDEATLQARLHSEELAGFELDQVIVSRADADSGLLYGSPSLFQRFYYQELRGLTTIPASGQSSAAAHSAAVPDWLAPFAFLIPAPAYAQTSTPDLEALIAQGEDIFFNETFDGNGRTCGTCHRAENNFTIDPAFIATLPPDDPLFVAEFNPDLAELENPTLMRQFGLIRANLDGSESPTEKFVMRSVSHLLGMSMSIQSNAVEPPFEMTGWSGDGAPGGGRLRDFSTGAVIQHATKTLDRQEGVDFRLPTDAELDALEAFMLSLGRQQDLNLQTLRLTDGNAERGRLLFIAEDSQGGTVRAAKCNICHGNAGALTIAGVNVNFKTGVENMPHPADVPGQVPPRDLQVRPRDGGFGKQLNESTGGFGDGSFNTQSLVEAADTAPYFHHNGATTLEDAIAFYESDVFRQSEEGQRLQLQDTGGQELTVDVDVLAAFLRAINALENIRSTTDFLTRAKQTGTVAGAQRLLQLAAADIDDALEVLAQSELHQEDAAPLLQSTKELISAAADAGTVSERDSLIDQAIADAESGRDLMVEASPNADTTKPTVAILAPVDGSTLFGTVTISADAADDVGVSSVVFKIGQTQIGQDATAPYEAVWDTTLFGDGFNQISVTAVDSSGNSQTASIAVTVDNASNAPPPDTTNPTVTITSPADGSTVAGTVTIAADALDDSGIDRVIFSVGQTEIGQVATPPFEQAWDTTAFPEGANQITVVAVDLSGNSQSASVTVTVDNVPATTCTVYSCPNPPPPPTEPPPPPVIPPGSSPDGEFGSVLDARDMEASTITITTGNGPLTLKITSETQFVGSIASNISELLPGHVVQGEFFQSTKEIVWIEADMPPGL